MRLMVNLFVEPIPPVYLCCDALLTAADIASASRFQHEGRRREHLAWRRIVRRELGTKSIIEYNAVGAPTVDTPNRMISVSHTKSMVAVAIADVPVGIDIELLCRDFEAVKSRYMTPQEMALATHEQWPAMVWTAKEALYKLYGHREIDLTDDLRIVGYDDASHTLHAEICDDIRAEVEIRVIDETALVAVATYAPGQ